MKVSSSIALFGLLAPSAIVAAPAKAWAPEDFKKAKEQLGPNALQKLTDGACDLGAVKFPADQTTLPPPSQDQKLYHVAIGYGTQNYTCSQTSKDAPVALGAVAQLYNLTCGYVRAPAVVADTTRYIYDTITADPKRYLDFDQPPPSSVAGVMLSGHHTFLDNTTPFFDLNTANGQFGQVAVKKANGSDAPVIAPPLVPAAVTVPWLKLDKFSGDFKTVYRLNTVGGSAPKTCEGITGAFQRTYAAEYHFYK